MRAGVRGACGTGVLVVSLIFTGGVSWAFKAKTHRDLNLRAAEASTLQTDDYLGQQLGFSAGLSERFNGKQVRQWIGDGGAAEDQFLGSEFFVGALNRSRHHFHNPLLSWDQAGLDGRCLFLTPVRGEASVRWAQSPEGQAGEPATWADARRLERDALTLSSKGERDSAWARLFQTLGQQMHLIADLAVPAHARNDIHCWPWSERLEVWALSEEGSKQIAGVQPINPDRSIFNIDVPISDPIAKVPVARLWDTDQYTSANPNPALTVSPLGTDPTIGLSEYTNANFFSQNTIFSPSFPFPARSSVQLKADKEIVPKTGEARRYITKVRDGEVIDHFAVPSALLEFLPPDLQTKKIGFDDTVFGDYAAKLFPRAIGYSAALIDYFFRGRLDVDLQLDPADSSFFQLVGANGSRDPLVDGVLTLYADSSSGERQAIASVGSLPVRGVEPGQDLFPVPVSFQPPEDAERFVAVYKGQLGNEVPSGSFPGGVIGKVLGGVRVEEVFSDGVRWKLRTPKGVFLLPLTVAEFEDLRWGDGDNTLVARAVFTPERPIRVVAYEVQRLPDSIELRTVDTSDGPEVQLTPITEAGFPFNMPALTTVQFSQTVQYRQQLVRYTRTFVSQWNPLFHEYDPLPTEYSPYQVETVHQQTVPFTESFPIVLNVAHNSSFGAERAPYVWSLQEVAADASGRLLGLVVVHLTFPTIPEVKLPSFNVDAGGGLAVAEQVSIFPAFPPGVGPLWVLVDLTEGRLVASTADSTITMVSQTRLEGGGWGSVPAFGTGGIGRHDFVRLEGGGPSDDLFDFGWSATSPPFRQRPAHVPPAEVTEFQTEEGFFGISVGGLPGGEVKDELARLGLVGFQLSTRTGDPIEVNANCSGATLDTCRTLWLVPSAGAVIQSPARLQEARRSRPAPAPGAERLVLTTQGDRILVWNPGTSARAVLDQPGVRFAGPVTRSTVMVFDFSGAMFEPSTLLVPLEGTRPPIVFPGQFLFGFTLLDPGYLYSVRDLKFFRGTPPLQRTALPARLADLPDQTNTVGDYHAIRVP